jgi:hypothetical protein
MTYATTRDDKRLGEHRQVQLPYEGPNRRSTTSRRADELEQITEQERQDLILRLLEEDDER